ncbi:MAG: zf-TFIIB domain-containing protein [Kofleriaceae bacterium]
MILGCPTCDGRYDVTGHPVGQQFRCRCGTILTLEAPSRQAGALSCPQCGANVAATASSCDHCSAHLMLKACPRCLSRVFHGHKHCPDCGAELSLVATTEPSTERPCPRCDAALAPRLISDVVIDECLSCRGMFLDQVAIQRVVADRQQVRAEALLGALPRAEIAPNAPKGKLYIKCPVCQVTMNRRQFATGSGVVVDVCRVHGTFFDTGELPVIIEFVMNGGLERAERKQLEALREAAKREQKNARYSNMMAARSSTHALAEAQRGSDPSLAFIELLSTLWR